LLRWLRGLSLTHNGSHVVRSLRVETVFDRTFSVSLFAKSLTTSRAHSMKRSTTGLRVRFFRVTILTGHGRAGSLIGSVFSEQKRATDLAWAVRYGPLATK